jgi:acetyl esterase
MPLNPQAEAFFEAGRASGAPPIWTLEPAAAREGSAVIVGMIGDGPAVANVEELQIPVRDAVIAGRRYAPEGAHGTIVWLHGGGWVLDGLDGADAMCRILANAAGATVVSVDYRVAPEHPFPVPLDDCWDALHWIAEREEGPLVLGGDSAGGNMTAVCAIRARDAGGPALAGQVLVYPVTDHDMATASYREHGDSGLLLGAREMEWFFDHYVADPAQRSNPEVSPLRAERLDGLPPAIVVAAGYDPLYDEVVAYARRLEEAGVPVTVHDHPDDAHAFFTFVNIMDSGNAAVTRVGADVRELIAGATERG